MSKNAEGDVLEVFEKRSDMILKKEHIVAHRINWEPKPNNIVSLGRIINVGLIRLSIWMTTLLSAHSFALSLRSRDAAESRLMMKFSHSSLISGHLIRSRSPTKIPVVRRCTAKTRRATSSKDRQLISPNLSPRST